MGDWLGAPLSRQANLYSSFLNICQDGPFAPVLKELDLPILKNTDCEASYKKAGFWEEIPDIFVCAGYKDGRKDTCEVSDDTLFS